MTDKALGPTSPGVVYEIFKILGHVVVDDGLTALSTHIRWHVADDDDGSAGVSHEGRHACAKEFLAAERARHGRSLRVR
jgi:hypothetical protein